MRAIACCLLLLCSALLGAVEWRPAKASITMRRGGEPKIFYVTTVGIDQVMAGQSAEATVMAQINYRDIRNIEWLELQENMYYAKAMGDMSSDRFEDAIKNFEKAAQSRKQVLYIKAYEGLADAYAGLKQYDKAVAALDKIVAENPKWPWLPDIIYRKGELLMATGQLDEADKAFVSLDGYKTSFGANAESASLLGRAEVMVARKNPAGAAALLAEAFGKTNADDNPELRGRIGLKLAAQQEAAGKAAEALATLEQIKFLPLPGDDLSRVHAKLADVLLDKGDLRAAFDHAVFGNLVPDAGDGVRSDARAVARKVRAAIEKDASFSNEEKLAYRQAYEKL